MECFIHKFLLQLFGTFISSYENTYKLLSGENINVENILSKISILWKGIGKLLNTFIGKAFDLIGVVSAFPLKVGSIKFGGS